MASKTFQTFSQHSCRSVAICCHTCRKLEKTCGYHDQYLTDNTAERDTHLDACNQQRREMTKLGQHRVYVI